MTQLPFFDLRRIDYNAAWELQRTLQQEQIAGRRGVTVHGTDRGGEVMYHGPG